MTTTRKTNNTRNKLASSVRRAKTTAIGSSENPVKANAEKLPSTRETPSREEGVESTLSTSTGQRVWPD
ncbi:hypothetical protein [Hydrogenovibrio halophilus]|uniref:hypothetical protein n=1 Tax=Hydrogenovibrio halophilus TaxID=373391 RepID=UPI000371562A|nr:hypothetical protein [Hydrogenovibrio halophilus]